MAGVNGAGKTTLVKRFLPDLPFVNADEIAQALSPADPRRAAVAAGRAVLKQFDSIFEHGTDVAWETTLSGSFHRRVIATARKQGYRAGAIYVGVESAELAVRRVSDRVHKGGHNVPEPDIRRRYLRSRQNLLGLLASVDHAFVFDNSGVGPKGYRRVMRVEHSVVTRTAPPIPNWLREAFGSRSLDAGTRLAP